MTNPSFCLRPSSAETVLILLQSGTQYMQFWRNYQSKLLLLSQHHPWHHPLHVTGQDLPCNFAPYLFPPCPKLLSCIYRVPPGLADSCLALELLLLSTDHISPVLLTWWYYLCCWLPLELLTAQTEGSWGERSCSKDDWWKLGSGVNHGKNECIWESLIKQLNIVMLSMAYARLDLKAATKEHFSSWALQALSLPSYSARRTLLLRMDQHGMKVVFLLLASLTHQPHQQLLQMS